MPSVVCLSLCYADAYFVDWNGRNRCCFSLSLAGTMACEFVTPTASPKVRFAGTFIEPPEVMISPAIAIQGALCCSPIILSPWNAGFPRIIWFLVSCVFFLFIFIMLFPSHLELSPIQIHIRVGALQIPTRIGQHKNAMTYGCLGGDSRLICSGSSSKTAHQHEPSAPIRSLYRDESRHSPGGNGRSQD